MYGRKQIHSAILALSTLLAWGVSSVLAQTPPTSPADIERAQTAYKLIKEAHKLIPKDSFFQAKQILEQAATLDPNPNSAFIHNDLAFVYSKLGNPERSVLEYQKALHYNPGLKSAAWNIALTYKDLSQYDQAILWLNKYINENPGPEEVERAEGLIRSLTQQTATKAIDNPVLPDYLDHLISVGGAKQWCIERLPLKIFIEEGVGVKGYRPSFKKLTVDGFDAWVKASQGKLGYVWAKNPDNADIVVHWTADPAEVTPPTGGVAAEQGLTTVSHTPPRNGLPQIHHCFVSVLCVPRQGTHPMDDDEMKEVCMHEVGHALGLGGHSTNPSDIMYFSQSSRQLPGLTKRDRATMARLYGNYPELASARMQYEQPKWP